MAYPSLNCSSPTAPGRSKQLEHRIGSSMRSRDATSECGDRCGWWATSERIVMAVVDSLGRGPDEAYAVNLAMACIGGGLERSFAEIFTACDARLRNTRGVALAVAMIDLASGALTMASVGNVRGVLLSANKEYRMGVTAGIAGGDHARLNPLIKKLSSGDVLMLCSDSVNVLSSLRETLASSAPYAREQALAVLHQWARADDDAAVLIYHHAS